MAKQNVYEKACLSSSSNLTSDSIKSSVSNTTGFGRNKTILMPGHSLMDWIFFTNSEVDLTCKNFGTKRVSGTELSKHNKIDDAWTSIEGIVFNITPYFNYHPGGVDELLRAAGKESTQLFKQIHSWVNWTCILQKCKIGFLVYGTDVQIAELNKTNDLNSIKKSNKIPLNEIFDWEETLNEIILKFIMKNNCRLSDIFVDLTDEKKLKVKIRTKINEKEFYVINYNLKNQLKQDISITQTENKIFKVTLNKYSQGIWNSLGDENKFHNAFYNEKLENTFYRKVELIFKKKISFNTFLFEFKIPKGLILPIEYGNYINLRIKNDLKEISRFYTPVPDSLVDENQEHITIKNMQYEDCHNLNFIKFIIKIYQKGKFTSELEKIDVGDKIELSDPFTINFDLKGVLKSKKIIYLIAAGTGITPMLNVLELAKMYYKNSILLLFFNKSQQDIILEKTFSNLKSSSDFKFTYKHILSSPTNEWQGFKGRINGALIKELIHELNNDSFVFLCGPDQFNVAVSNLLDSVYKLNKENVYLFTN